MLGALKNLFSGKSDTPANTYWQGTIGLTLMVYKNDLETHVQSEIRRYDYFFKLADDVRKSSPPADIEKRLLKAVQDIYLQHRLHFQQAEPNDLNYIAVVETAFRPLIAQEAAAKPWLTARPPHWEQSHCLMILADRFERAAPNTF